MASRRRFLVAMWVAWWWALGGASLLVVRVVAGGWWWLMPAALCLGGIAAWMAVMSREFQAARAWLARESPEAIEAHDIGTSFYLDVYYLRTALLDSRVAASVQARRIRAWLLLLHGLPALAFFGGQAVTVLAFFAWLTIGVHIASVVA